MPEPGSQHQSGHNRSFSDPDIEFANPADWYQNGALQTNDAQTQVRAPSKGHARSQSEVTVHKVSMPPPPPQAPSQPLEPSSSSHIPAPSKLPVAIRKRNSPTTSAPSTRSNSPTKLKSSQPNGRTSRAGTPISRAKTPTQSSAGRKHIPAAAAKPNSTSRLQPAVTPPVPKMSPPLRSSRPRQPVSAAMTASSRSKAASNGKSTQPSKQRTAEKKGEVPARRRKISVGPIDFEQRREHIRLAYSKSIRESQALEARKRAADRKRKEMEAAEEKAAELRAAEQAAEQESVAKLAAEQRTVDQATANIEPAAVSDPVDFVAQQKDAPTATGTEYQPSAHNDTDREIAVEPKRETIANQIPVTSSELAKKDSVAVHEAALVGEAEVADAVTPVTPDDIPGSFPAFSPLSEIREPPLRPASIASETTEFDAEPQEHPPVQAISPLEAHTNVNSLLHVSSPVALPQRAEYQYPFDGDNTSPALSNPHQDATEEYQSSSYDNDYRPRMSVPGAFDDYEDEDEDRALHQAIGIGLGLQSLSGGPLSAGAESASPQETHKIPFPRLEVQDGSDCQSEVHDISEVGHEFDHTDACTDGTDEGELRDGDVSECPTGGLASRRDSSCASSPEPDAVKPPKLDTLTVPSVMSPTQRLSQQSAWTDVTVDSANCSDAAMSPNLISPESPIYGHATIYHSTPTWRESQFSATENRYSGYSDSRANNESNRSSAAYMNQPYGYASPSVVSPASYLSPELSATSFQIPVPSHEPPPVPMSATSSIPDSRRESSTFNDASQYDSTVLDSGRGSEDFMSPMESAHSASSAPLGTQDSLGSTTPLSGDTKSISQSSEDMAKKERHRLVQRRNVIKELLDTEAVFVRDMNIVEEIYKGTAEACPNLDDKTVKLIFRNTNEIIDFHTSFLAQVKEAVASVYVPKSGRTTTREDSVMSDTPSSAAEVSDDKDREVLLGPVFIANMELMKLAHEGFLRNSDHAAKRLIEIQQDPAVKVWLNECNEVAKDLTAAWDLDSLLIKPMQRITKYPNLIITLLQHTGQDHPDREALLGAREVLETAIIEINKTKKNFELVGQIVGRKRKESDVRTGFARAFGKRVDKLQTSSTRPTEDAVYAKLNEKFGDDYLRLQVVLRDVEFYTRQVTTNVHDFLQYLSSVELVMRLQPGSYPELESKWVQFNISIRDLEKVTLEEHLAQVRKHVIEPFELVIKAYGNPALAMKKRQKRRVDYERSEQLRRAGKSVDSKVKELAEQYEALNEALKRELPQLSALTEKVGNICLGNLVNIQAKWYSVWKDKMKTVLGDCPDMPDLKEIVSTFNRDFPYAQEQLSSIGILNPAYKGRASLSTTVSADDSISRGRPRPLELDSRGRGLSVNMESSAPSLPIPDFAQRSSDSFSISPSHNSESKALPSPHQYYYNYSESQTSVLTSGLTMSPEMTSGSRSAGGAGVPASTRPSTGRSFDSAPVRQSIDSTPLNRRDSNATYGSGYTPQDSKRFSGLFHSALPPTDSAEEGVRSSRASSRERGPPVDGYNVLWLAASLFEFNIATTKHEAGYPYLVYQAGEIFDVVAEKGELWLAKNQDDPKEKVGWIWSKHFAKLADS